MHFFNHLIPLSGIASNSLFTGSQKRGVNSKPGSTADDDNPLKLLGASEGIHQGYSPTEGVSSQNHFFASAPLDVLPEPINTFFHTLKSFTMGLSWQVESMATREVVALIPPDVPVTTRTVDKNDTHLSIW